MPNIPVYTNEVAPPTQPDMVNGWNEVARRTQTLGREGAEAVSGGLDAIGRGFDEAGRRDAQAMAKQNQAELGKERSDAANQKALEAQQSHTEINQGLIDHALANVTLMQDWNKTASTTDPNNLAAAANQFLHDRVLPEQQKFISSFQTQKGQDWASQKAAETIGNWYTHASADSTLAAGHAAVQNLTQATNLYAGMPANDPSQLDFALHQIDSATTSAAAASPLGVKNNDALSSHAEAQKGQAVESAVRGAFTRGDAGIDAGLAILRNPSYQKYLSPEQQEKLNSDAITWKKENDTQRQADQQQVWQQTNTASGIGAAQHLMSLTNPTDGSLQLGPAWTKQVLADKDLKPADQQAVLDARQRLVNTGDIAKSSPTVLEEFSNQISDGAPPTVADVAGHIGIDLTRADAAMLMDGVLPGSKTSAQDFSAISNAMATAHAALYKGRGRTPDYAGNEAYDKFTSWFMPTYRAELAQGKTSSQLLDPNSPDYMLKGDALQAFAPTPADALRHMTRTDAAAALRGGGTPNAEIASNNFGGMRMPGVPVGGGPASNPRGWQHFPTPEAGVAAIQHQLTRYAIGATFGHPVDTVRGIVSKWGPEADHNPTAANIERASKIMGVGPDVPLDLNNPAVMSKMIEATIRNEQGGRLPVSMDTIQRVTGATNMRLPLAAIFGKPSPTNAANFDGSPAPAVNPTPGYSRGYTPARAAAPIPPDPGADPDAGDAEDAGDSNG